MRPPEFVAAARQGGLRAHARAVLEKLHRTGHPLGASPVFAAGISLAMGDKETALSFLETACRQHRPRLIWIKARMGWDALNSDPRFQALLKRMHFPD